MRLLGSRSRAFPKEVARANKSTLRALGASALSAPLALIEVTYQGKRLSFPYRVYYSIDLVDEAIMGSGDSSIVAACLGSRHKDGFLRQRCVEALLRHPRPWSAPYLMEALDERPVQILEAVAGQIPPELLSPLANFAVENEPRFLSLCYRSVSLWNEFYRYPGAGVHVPWREYPGARLIAEITAAARAIAPRFATKSQGAIPNGGLRPFDSRP